MYYVISDLHGCYREYTALLKKINFSDRDYLYVLGDAVDRGTNPMNVLKDIMRRNNVTLQIKLTCKILQCIYRMVEFPQ